MQRYQKYLNDQKYAEKMAFLAALKSEPETKSKIDALWARVEDAE